jgi:hypothetical protein
MLIATEFCCKGIERSGSRTLRPESFRPEAIFRRREESRVQTDGAVSTLIAPLSPFR